MAGLVSALIIVPEGDCMTEATSFYDSANDFFSPNSAFNSFGRLLSRFLGIAVPLV